jgi:hypothetical protein
MLLHYVPAFKIVVAFSLVQFLSFNEIMLQVLRNHIGLNST